MWLGVVVVLVVGICIGCKKDESSADSGDDEITAACENLETLLARGGDPSGSAPEMAECRAELTEMSKECDEVIACVADAGTEDDAMSCLLACAFKTSAGGGEGGDGDAPRLPDRPPPSDR